MKTRADKSFGVLKRLVGDGTATKIGIGEWDGKRELGRVLVS